MTRLYFFASFIPDQNLPQLKQILSDVCDPALRCSLPHQYHQTFYPPFACVDSKRLIRSVTDRFEWLSTAQLRFTEFSIGPSLTDSRLVWVKGKKWDGLHPLQPVLTEAIVECNRGSMDGVISQSSAFLPHITLGRFLPGIPPLLFEPQPVDLSIAFSTIALVETVHHVWGSDYRILSEWSLL